MKSDARTVCAQRCQQQLLGSERAPDAASAVHRLGALQAQDYVGALWSIALRTSARSREDVVQALARGDIVRSWPLRGTLHIVAGVDLRWMLALIGPRMFASNARRREALGLTAPLLARYERTLVKALSSTPALTRDAVMALWQEAGLEPSAQRGYHVLHTLSLLGVICFGPRSGNDDTFTLLDTFVPRGPTLVGDEALCELARRYFTSHGPASVQDFARWCGVSVGEARRAHAAAEVPELALAPAAPDALLLSGFDEYVLGYGDRSAIVADEHAPRIVPGNNGIFLPTLLVRGQLRGLWKVEKKRKSARVIVRPFVPLAARLRPAIARAAAQYGAFIGAPVELALEAP